MAVVGRIQEQHPQRCRLFMQWQQMDWPVVIDPLNLLELKGIPIVTAIDEHGVAHEVTPEDFEEEFMGRDFAPPAAAVPVVAPVRPDIAALKPAADADAAVWGAYGAALYLWAEDRLDAAVAAFERAAALAPEEGRWHFRLGVCLRRRYDGPSRQAGDFQAAVAAWGAALALDPNQYIWRRRIQQYGPRLDKPYPFYDWVHAARQEITRRGEKPAALAVEPAGAEFAAPLEVMEAEAAPPDDPDPDGRIWRDGGKLVQVETVVVPASVAPGGSVRVHLALRPNPDRKVHWNNEVDALQVWIEPPPGWQVERRLMRLDNPPEAVSAELRRLDFELTCGDGVQPGAAELPAYALYYICEDVDGTCLYRRQDLVVPLQVAR